MSSAVWRAGIRRQEKRAQPAAPLAQGKDSWIRRDEIDAPTFEVVVAMIEHEDPDRAGESDGERNRFVRHADGRSWWPREDLALEALTLPGDEVANGIGVWNGGPQEDAGRE